MLSLILLGCAGGLTNPADIEGDAAAPVLVWDDSLMMGVDVAAGNWDDGSMTVWSLTAIECEDIIASPLAVGDVPDGTEEFGDTATVLPLVEGDYIASFYRCVDQGYGDGPEKTPVGDREFTVDADGNISM